MEQVQIEELVAELETRVDRLRSLYEQYFMGIEKMEPHVPRKDVERRFQAMRREQIRNTALRFRFHMVLQKYNTYQSYWMRIMRQIEDGTYKRDVMRARANLGERRSTRPPPAPIEKPKEKERSASIDDLMFESDPNANEAPTRKVDIPRAREQSKSASDLMAEFSPFDEATTKRNVPAELSADEDPTGILPLVGNTPKARLAPDPEKLRQLAARIKAGKDEKDLLPPPPSSRPATAIHKPPPMKPPTVPGAFKPLAPPITAAAAAPAAAAPAMKPPTLPSAIKPAAPPLPAHAMKPPQAPASAPSGIKPQPPPVPAAAMKPPTAPGPFKPLAPPMGAAPATKLPQPPTPAATAKPTTAAVPAPSPKAGNQADLSDARVRQIYSQYVETKRKQNESTTAITYEGVAKSLRESTARLKEKHGSNSVDFEVTVKDGKTILRPVLKKDAK